MAARCLGILLFVAARSKLALRLARFNAARINRLEHECCYLRHRLDSMTARMNRRPRRKRAREKTPKTWPLLRSQVGKGHVLPPGWDFVPATTDYL